MSQPQEPESVSSEPAPGFADPFPKFAELHIDLERNEDDELTCIVCGRNRCLWSFTHRTNGARITSGVCQGCATKEHQYARPAPTPEAAEPRGGPRDEHPDRCPCGALYVGGTCTDCGSRCDCSACCAARGESYSPAGGLERALELLRDVWVQDITTLTSDDSESICEAIEILESLRSLSAAQERLAAEQRETERLKSLINRDRTGLAAALVEVKHIARGFNWIAAGEWGSYDYTQQTVATLQGEVGNLIERILQAAERSLNESGDRAHEAFHPKPSPAQGEHQKDPVSGPPDSNGTQPKKCGAIVGWAPCRLDADHEGDCNPDTDEAWPAGEQAAAPSTPAILSDEQERAWQSALQHLRASGVDPVEFLEQGARAMAMPPQTEREMVASFANFPADDPDEPEAAAPEQPDPLPFDEEDALLAGMRPASSPAVRGAPDVERALTLAQGMLRSSRGSARVFGRDYVHDVAFEIVQALGGTP